MMNNANELAFYRLPFKEGTRILEKSSLHDILDDNFSDLEICWASFKRFDGHLCINQLETLAFGVCNVYLKVTEDALLVACTLGTTETRLSQYAAHFLWDSGPEDDIDFSCYYWPDVYGENCRKYLTYRRKNRYEIEPSLCLRPAYRGLYRSGTELPKLTGQGGDGRRTPQIILDPARIQIGGQRILGFCFSELEDNLQVPGRNFYLVPFIAKATKDGKSIRAYHSFIDDWPQQPDVTFSQQEEQLMELAFRINEETFVPMWENKLDDEESMNKMFDYWHRAIPLFSGIKHRRYTYAYGPRCMKGKAQRKYVLPYEVNLSVPKLVFIWTDRGDSYCLKIRVKVNRKLYQLSKGSQAACFIKLKDQPGQFFLLSTLDESRLIYFFASSHRQMVILKSHYHGEVADFISRLRELYEFRG